MARLVVVGHRHRGPHEDHLFEAVGVLGGVLLHYCTSRRVPKENNLVRVVEQLLAQVLNFFDQRRHPNLF